MKLFKLVRKWQTDEGEGSIDTLFIFADDTAEAILIASAETHGDWSNASVEENEIVKGIVDA